MKLAERQSQIESNGYCLLNGVFSAEECAQLAADLQQSLTVADPKIVQRRGDVIYGARDLLRVFPPAAHLARREPLLGLLRQALGESYGLVRGLFFDKPEGAGWSLPWDRDLTIAVKDNKLPSRAFSHPTFKAGIPHVEAPSELLAEMLTLRIHLDDVTEANGPLRVAPGSHRLAAGANTVDGDGQVRTQEIICAAAGDVLVMRPLLLHSSAGVEDAEALQSAGDTKDAQSYSGIDAWSTWSLRRIANCVMDMAGAISLVRLVLRHS